MRLGVPELIVVLIAALVWVVPVAAAVWALFTLHRIRTTQEEMRNRLAGIERALQNARPS